MGYIIESPEKQLQGPARRLVVGPRERWGWGPRTGAHRTGGSYVNPARPGAETTKEKREGDQAFPERILRRDD
jgi:hypothetical protein